MSAPREAQAVEVIRGVELTNASVDAIARRLLELLDERDRPATTGPLVDTATLAAHLGVSVDTVRRHASQLGGQAVGGERGRGRPLRFDLDAAAKAWATAREPSNPSLTPESSTPATNRPRRKRPDSGSETELLPVCP